MSSDPRTSRLSETCAERGPNRPLHTKGGSPNYVEKSLAAAAEPFKGISTDGTIIPGLFGIQKIGVSTQSIREAAESFLGSLTAEQHAETLFFRRYRSVAQVEQHSPHAYAPWHAVVSDERKPARPRLRAAAREPQ